MPATVHHFPARGPARATPLLFVHGAYTHALGWQQHFIPHFTALGFDCHALDFSGHGASPGQEHLDDFGLDDYVADLAAAVAALPCPPVLIAHSMGCTVAQRYLETGQAAGLALRAPVPPTGTGGSAGRLALEEPDFFAELPKVTVGTPDDHTLEVMARVYFAPGTPLQTVADCLPMIQPESSQAVAELATLALRRAGHKPRLPVLVLGGREDRVFPPSMLFFTTLPWNARQVVIEGAGHMLMLEPTWPQTTEALAAWLDSLPGQGA